MLIVIHLQLQRVMRVLHCDLQVLATDLQIYVREAVIKLLNIRRQEIIWIVEFSRVDYSNNSNNYNNFNRY